MNIRDIPEEVLERLQAVNSAETWQAPEAIKRELPKVTPLREAMLPSTLTPWLTDIAERMQCPLDYVAIAALVAASSVVGTGCAVRPKAYDDWTVVPNLWGAVVGEPGALKTPALTEAMRPLIELEDKAIAQYDADRSQYLIDMMMYKLTQDQLKKQMATLAKQPVRSGTPPTPVATNAQLASLRSQLIALQEPQEPKMRRFRSNDSTVEKLLELMRDNPRGLLIFRDELAGMLAHLDREENAGDRAFHLEAWNGNGSYISDRIGRGTTHAKIVCESVLGGIQPGKLEEYLTGAIGGYENDGLMQRLQLLVYPDPKGKWKLVDRKPNQIARSTAVNLVSGLADVDFVALGATRDASSPQPHFRFDESAQKFFNRWLTRLEKQLRGDEPEIIRQHLSKYRSLMPSLALIFHLLDLMQNPPIVVQTPPFPPPVPKPIPLEAAKLAAAWCAYLETHARRVYGLSIDPGYGAATRLAERIEQGQLEDGFKLRDVYRKGWAGLNREEAQSAIKELRDAGWVREIRAERTGTGRPPLATYQINPAVLKQGRNFETGPMDKRLAKRRKRGTDETDRTTSCEVLGFDTRTIDAFVAEAPSSTH